MKIRDWEFRAVVNWLVYGNKNALCPFLPASVVTCKRCFEMMGIGDLNTGCPCQRLGVEEVVRRAAKLLKENL